MKQIKELQAEHIYQINGTSSANSAFFENEGECKEFLRLADEYLGGYMSINCFQHNRDGWVMIITTKDVKSIRAAYKVRRALSDKCKPECELNETWRILSDTVRIWLSTYVKWKNRQSNRTGGLVSANYERYVFESVEEANARRLEMEEQRVDQAQARKRYRPSGKLYNVTKKRMRNSIYMCCKALEADEKVRELGLKCLDLAGMVQDVLRQIIPTTFQHHFPVQ